MKNRCNNGFGIIEAMIALVVCALTITPLLNITLKVITDIKNKETMLNHIYALRYFLEESRLINSKDLNYTRQETIENTDLSYTRTEINEKSNFKEALLTKEIVTITPQGGKPKTLFSFYAIIPEEKKDNTKTKNLALVKPK